MLKRIIEGQAPWTAPGQAEVVPSGAWHKNFLSKTCPGGLSRVKNLVIRDLGQVAQVFIYGGCNRGLEGEYA